MKESLSILKNKYIINEKLYLFLNQARLLRNRISHRYKEPSREELLEFIDMNMDNFYEVLAVAKGCINIEK
ncbi:MAG TPA: hypothetical protein DIU45_01315 [Clostridium sp.]|nr:hypothetical protein [Clostridium sp.]